MEILAFNASPRKNMGTTDIILDQFLNTAEQAGATTTKHYVTELHITGCIGCFTCWTKTPGRCIHRDDMDHIIPEFGEADIIVFATPIYNGNIIHYLQRMTERFLPTALPWQVEDGETTRHPERHQRKPQKGILIASAGFPDYQAFNIAKELYPKFLHITLPAAQLITDPETSIYIKDFTDAVQEAAKLLVQRENISPKLVRRLNVQYNSEMKQIIRDQANTYFKANLED